MDIIGDCGVLPAASMFTSNQTGFLFRIFCWISFRCSDVDDDDDDEEDDVSWDKLVCVLDDL